ncbi:hypothetical protein E8E11_001149 [Didymella keratinophila]|nr:hypothetical protein E8E11_001149 [Didymella keratinophila]
MDPQERARLDLENVQLAQVLLEMERELNAAKQATRDLAAWTLNERTGLVTEALHQPDSHVEYLQAPSQEVEDDQAYNVTDELLATEDTDKWRFSVDHLPRCRKWQTEWKPKGYTTDREKIKFLPHWLGKYTTQPIYAPAWLTIARKKLEERNERMKRGFFVEGVVERNLLEGEQWMQKADWMMKEAEKSEQEQIQPQSAAAASEAGGSQVLEEGELQEDEKSAHLPPDDRVSAAIVEQVDALIAEGRGKLPCR